MPEPVASRLKRVKLNEDRNVTILSNRNEMEFSMKKFFTLIAFTCAFIPAIQGMANSLPADVQKKYDHLAALINNADVEAFKPTFDALTPLEKITLGSDFEQSVIKARVVINTEIESLGDNNKNWSKIAKGGLASVGGAIAGISGIAGLIGSFNHTILKSAAVYSAVGSLALLALMPTFLFSECIMKLGGDLAVSAVAATSILYLEAAYKGLNYGPKTLKAGFNYKKHLQDQLTNLDAIAAYMHENPNAVQEQAN